MFELLRWRHSRTIVRMLLLMVAGAMIFQGFFGPSLAPKNLATVLGWVHFRGVLVLVLLCAGNFFCFACPFMLVRDAARRVIRPAFNWPRPLRNKWLAAVLLAAIFYCYELFSLWSSPLWTAWLIVAYFVGAVAVDSVFKHASFCKFVCPIGQFNFVASLVSPLEVKVRDAGVCTSCRTKDCIKGRFVTGQPQPVQRGCELALFQPLKVGNMDCTFCLDCVQACPHDNVGILSRPIASELSIDPIRSGIGRFSRRRDLSALVIVFTFGALANAFGMVTPVYSLEASLSRMLGVNNPAPALGLIFGTVLIGAPAFALGLAAWATKAGTGSREGLLPIAVRYSYALVPLGFGLWLAHYGYHFLTGILTAVPVIQSAVGAEPMWKLTGLPVRFVQPLEMGTLALALAASLIVIYKLAEEDSPARVRRAFAPWATVAVLVWCAAFWLILQPMDMRGTLMAG